MITLDELQNKELGDLIPLAKELGVKKPSSEKEDLIYQILDIQAENYASNAPQKERRNRKSHQSVTSDDASQPKKRGRKSKSQQEEVSVQATEEDSALNKKRGRKSKSNDMEGEELNVNEAIPSSDSEDNANSGQSDKKRRGRPRRSEVAEEETQQASDKKGDVTPGTPAKKMLLVRTVSSGLTLASRKKPATGKISQENVEGVGVAETAVEPENTEIAAHISANEKQEVVDTPVANAPAMSANTVDTSVEKPSEGFVAESNQEFGEFFPKKETPSPSRFVSRKTAAEPREQKTTTLRQDSPVSIQEPTASSQQSARKGKHAQTQAFDFNGLIECSGVLEIMPEGHGFLRSADFNYMPSPDDVYLTREQIRSSHIKTGDVVECMLRAPRENDKYFPMARLLRVNGRSPEFIRDRVPFEHLTPLFPDEKFDLTSGRTCNISTRVVDMFSPIGKGQRGLIVAPPKTGKTILLKDIANAIAENHPETYIMILLIDERPEEVTDMIRSVNAEVISSTFDEPADRHVRIANIVLEKAKRMVECGHDVVILLDSITRLARAYNTVTPTSSKILSGGVDANALQKPKRFFGAARNIENGGSLTIIATALTETSSKMDEVIFEEFKGTGNMELQLDRKLSNKRVFPAVDIMASSTRRDDLLLRQETQNRMWILRRFLSDRNSIEAMEFIKDRMERTTDNDELLRTMNE